MERKPDIKVTFHLYGKDEVNEEQKIYARKGYASSGYRPQHKIEENKLADGIHQYKQEKINPGENAEGTITFLSPESYPHSLWIDKKIDIQEGERIIGYAIIKEIYNKSLEKTKDKIICKCESELTLEELQEASEHVPSMYNNILFATSIFPIILATIANLLYGRTLLWWIEYFFVCEVAFAIGLKINLKTYIKNIYESEQKKSQIDSKYCNEFYDNYFVRSSEHITRKIEYSKLKKIIETDDDFYLLYDNMIFIIQKSKCDSKTIDFIREKAKSTLKNKNKQNKNEIKNYHTIKNILNILFIATLISLYGCIATTSILIDKLTETNVTPVAFNIWSYWLWLVIPALSIGLAVRYKNKGFKCKKNIIAGTIVGIILLLYGLLTIISFSTKLLFPNFDQDYKHIYNYSEILKVELPSDGTLITYKTQYGYDMGEVTVVRASYEEENAEQLEIEIENSSNWIAGKSIKSELKIFIPSTMSINNNKYFSIYNETTKEYNRVPEQTGTYKMYVMMFDKEKDYLEINEFEYSYVE